KRSRISSRFSLGMRTRPKASVLRINSSSAVVNVIATKHTTLFKNSRELYQGAWHDAYGGTTGGIDAALTGGKLTILGSQ
ncbi:hypothetical protein MLD52_20565, partial [Puniceicoccaceae bacterium K14]|nr:hypothetical protein [Puniceicoccaceae bacterium K14]